MRFGYDVNRSGPGRPVYVAKDGDYTALWTHSHEWASPRVVRTWAAWRGPLLSGEQIGAGECADGEDPEEAARECIRRDRERRAGAG